VLAWRARNPISSINPINPISSEPAKVGDYQPVESET